MNMHNFSGASGTGQACAAPIFSFLIGFTRETIVPNRTKTNYYYAMGMMFLHHSSISKRESWSQYQSKSYNGMVAENAHSFMNESRLEFRTNLFINK